MKKLLKVEVRPGSFSGEKRVYWRRRSGGYAFAVAPTEIIVGGRIEVEVISAHGAFARIRLPGSCAFVLSYEHDVLCGDLTDAAHAESAASPRVARIIALASELAKAQADAEVAQACVAELITEIAGACAI